MDVIKGRLEKDRDRYRTALKIEGIGEYEKKFYIVQLKEINSKLDRL